MFWLDRPWPLIGLALAGCTSSHRARGAAGAWNPMVDGSVVGANAELDGADSGDGGEAGGCGVPTSFKWSSTGPILGPISDATHDLVAVKDPSVVFYNGEWHVFVSTVAVGGIYGFAYLNFADFHSTSAPFFYYLDKNPALAGYHAAPQIFYFRPQSQWYLIFQSGQPQYSTNTDVTNPSGWTAPANFFGSQPDVVQEAGQGGWLDFKVICDSANCYLFFSDDHGSWYRSQTTLASFPKGFGNTVIVMQDSNAGRLFEASNVYFMRGAGKYLALVEAFDADSSYHRYYRSWTADALDGTWTPLQDTFAAPFASTADITFPGGQWTNDISHGEMIRPGYDQTMTVDTCHLQYLYQGTDPSAPNDAGYNGIPWRLGLLTSSN